MRRFVRTCRGVQIVYLSQVRCYEGRGRGAACFREKKLFREFD